METTKPFASRSLTRPAAGADVPRPVLPRTGTGGGDDALAGLHRFHLGAPGVEAVEPGPDLLPALVAPFRKAITGAERLRTDYPLFLGPPGGGEKPLCLALPDLLERLAPDGEGGRLLRDNLLRLEQHVRRLVAGLTEPADARDLLARAGGAMLEALGLPEADRTQLASELDAFLAQVPAGGRFVPEGPGAPLELMRAAALARFEPARQAFRAEVAALAATLDGRVAADRLKGEASREPAALSDRMGQLGARFIDPDALAGRLGKPRGGSALSAARRESLERALEVLRAFLAAEDGDRPLLVRRGAARKGRGKARPGTPPGAWRPVAGADPCTAAADAFDREAEKVAALLRAVRVARLETADEYDPERHDPRLARLDWQAFSRDELALVPPVVVELPADDLARRSLLSLSRLLVSGRPVQVMVPIDPAGSPGAADDDDPLSGYRFEPGYLGISHREVLVQQASPVRPVRMMEGFLRAAAATHTALHVLATTPASPTGDGAPAVPPFLAAGAALESRAHPLFLFDPEAGSTWARRLEFSGNPSPEADWPVRELAVVREGGGEETLDLPFTFADYALLFPAYRHCFRPVPDAVAEGQEDGLMPLVRYLELAPQEAADAVPYVWAVDAGRRLVRLAVDRPLALACRDRLDFWRTLQELAGVRSEYVEQAATRARQEAEGRAREERERLEAAHAAELERVRQEAEVAVAERLTAALFEIDVAAFAVPGGPLSPLAGLAGRSVDEVAGTLLSLVDPATLEAAPTAPEAADPRVDDVARQLLGWVEESEPAEVAP